MITIEHLVKNYGNTCAVDDVSFSVEEGEVVGFLGPNGAGKSTTMNILTGYLSSNAGRVMVNGVDMLKEPICAKQNIGYLPEQPPLYLDMTVMEYLSFNYELKKCTLEKEAHLKDICDTVKIWDVRNKLIRSLSKGYRQRVGIAQALVGNPKILIFDEPTVGLDPKQIIEIRNLIRGLGKKHTVILSTHILQEVQAVCDRIIIINRGKIVANEKTENIANIVTGNRRFNLTVAGPQKEVAAFLKAESGIVYCEMLNRHSDDSTTFMIETAVGADIRKKLFFRLAERGWPIMGLESLGMNLEDIFISVVEQSGEKEEPDRFARNAVRGRAKGNAENQVAQQLFEEAQKQREISAQNPFDDD